MIKILCVDDEADLQEVTKQFLEISSDIQVDTVLSAQEALDRLHIGKYDAVISDYQMPVMNGITFLKQMRATGNSIPFILFTGRGREEVVIEALNSGADFYLQKGGEVGPLYVELEHHIRKLVQLYRQEEESERTLSILESTMESTADGILVADGKGGIIRFNDIFRKMWGIPEAIIVSKNDDAALNFVLDQLKDPETFLKIVQSLYATVEKTSFDEIELKNGRIFERYSQPLRIGNSVAGRVWSFRDITDRRQMEKALQESEGRYRSLFVDSEDAIMIFSPERGFLTGNPASIQLFACRDEQDLMNHTPASLSPEYQPDGSPSAEKSQEMVELALLNGTHFFDWTHRKADGTDFQASVLLSCVETDGARYLRATVRDITDRKKTEEALRQKTALFEAQANASLDGILVIDENQKRILVNRRIVELFNVPKYIMDNEDDNMLLQHVVSLTKYPEQFLEKVLYLNDHINETSHDEIEFKNGMVLDRYSASVFGKDGKYYGRTWTFHDITERKHAEEALREAGRKLNLLSNITRHDLINQLMMLNGNLLLLEKASTDPTSNKYLQRAIASAERISATVQFTKTYEDIGVHAPIWQDLEDLVVNNVKVIPLNHVKMVTENVAGVEIYADPLIQKVFYNLIDNAVLYGGTITTLRFSVEHRDGKDLVVCADDGVGIPAEMKERLFTRGFGKNHGLGLFLSREILAITGITISEEGGPGQGARFVMTLPPGGLRGPGLRRELRPCDYPAMVDS